MLDAAGRAPRRYSTFQTATGEAVHRAIGYVIIKAGRFDCADDVVFGEPGHIPLLDVRPIGGFGVNVDYIAHGFVARTMLVATAR